jgi:hypothetical protein
MPTLWISTARDAIGMEDPALDFLRELEPRTWELAAWTRERVREADPDLTERLYRGWRGIGFRHPEAGYVCAIYPRSEWVVLLFEHGASLPDPEGVLQGDGTQTRFLRIAAADAATASLIGRYVQQAVAQRLLDRGG